MAKQYENSVPGLVIRQAEEADCGLILELIHGIAKYEKMEDQVVATEESLRESIFVRNRADVLIAEYEGRPVGYALYFRNFSTFVGRENMYLEDIFVWPEMRGKGIGKALLITVAKIANEEGCSRMDWVCLDWNTPSQAFYKSMGAEPHPEWLLFRAENENLKKLGAMM
mgnify:CR=1 FL=1